MRFYIDEILVLFPYDYIYPEQYGYMVELKKTLDAKGHSLLEMPSGTGKTITLLAFIVAYQQHHAGNSPKLVYCSRTVPEIEKALLELKKLIAYWEKETKKTVNFLALGLSSRKNLCLNPIVSVHFTKANNERNGKIVDAKCHSMTASFVRAQFEIDKSVQLCSFYENLEAVPKPVSVPNGVYTLDDLRSFGSLHKMCPYFLSRQLLVQANVVIYSYYYLLDPKVSELVSKDLPKNTIVVFDEAHNIDNVCIESLSVDLNRSILDASCRSLSRLENRVEQIKQVDARKLQEEYSKLVQGLKRSKELRLADEILINPSKKFLKKFYQTTFCRKQYQGT